MTVVRMMPTPKGGPAGLVVVVVLARAAPAEVLWVLPPCPSRRAQMVDIVATAPTRVAATNTANHRCLTRRPPTFARWPIVRPSCCAEKSRDDLGAEPPARWASL